MLGCGINNYAYYLFGVALNPFFVVYWVVMVLSAVTLILALASLDVSTVTAAIREKTPERLIGGYFMFVGFGLGIVWLVMLAAYAFAAYSHPSSQKHSKLLQESISPSSLPQ